MDFCLLCWVLWMEGFVNRRRDGISQDRKGNLFLLLQFFLLFPSSSSSCFSVVTARLLLPDVLS